MFERFTTSARESVTRALEIARAEGASEVGSGHVLLGVVGDGTTTAGRALDRLGIAPDSLAACLRTLGADRLDAEALAGVGVDLDAVRAQVEATFGPGALDAPLEPGRRTPSRPPFDAAAKKMLELALREAIRFRTKRLDTGHLLLAAARADGSTAQRALVWFGPDRTAVEEAVVAVWAEGVAQ